ncbi:Flp family type IVb pilin [Bacillus sp. B15-48]|uniref:Flp family type IVb pilin n=1 Tax=Bacillus sp. B15-48 TaxID=1548601 RepID=UPI00193FA8B9|nr:Flp family type IVb pilin [Bacillus sp. B15-48]MBM4764494.1 Flp family type IVb pilin [Bacillus sp. B15-48]
MLEKMKNLVMEEEGQGLSEYGLVLGVVVLAAVAALALFSDAIEDLFDEIVAALTL